MDFPRLPKQRIHENVLLTDWFCRWLTSWTLEQSIIILPNKKLCSLYCCISNREKKANKFFFVQLALSSSHFCDTNQPILLTQFDRKMPLSRIGTFSILLLLNKYWTFSTQKTLFFVDWCCCQRCSWNHQLHWGKK